MASVNGVFPTSPTRNADNVLVRSATPPAPARDVLYESQREYAASPDAAVNRAHYIRASVQARVRRATWPTRTVARELNKLPASTEARTGTPVQHVGQGLAERNARGVWNRCVVLVAMQVLTPKREAPCHPTRGGSLRVVAASPLRQPGHTTRRSQGLRGKTLRPGSTRIISFR